MSSPLITTFEAAAPRYDSSGAQFAGPVAEQLVALAAPRPGDQVLDVGCGAGAVAVRCARAISPDGQVTGLDLSEGMLRRTAAEAAARGFGNVRTRLGDAAEPPFAPASFDTVLASLVLYLLPDTEPALRHWRELLKPGGTLGFSWGIGPDPRWSPVFAAVDAFAKHAGFESYVRRVGSPDELAAQLAALGYTAVEVTTRTIDVRYTGPRQWWQASWAEAPRLAWQHIPDADRDTARRAAFALLDRMREPDGTLVRRVRMAFAIAERPAAESPVTARPATSDGASR
ncbi:MAG: methyltransferase domain-containing protein [Actinobacteria bacterium]|nr:methyltransferase domain-containing protein [Actinomycetota bacterium]